MEYRYYNSEVSPSLPPVLPSLVLLCLLSSSRGGTRDSSNERSGVFSKWLTVVRNCGNQRTHYFLQPCRDAVLLCSCTGCYQPGLGQNKVDCSASSGNMLNLTSFAVGGSISLSGEMILFFCRTYHFLPSAGDKQQESCIHDWTHDHE